VFVWWLLRPPSDELAAELGAEAGAGPDAAAPALEPLGETTGSSRAAAAFLPSARVAPAASGAGTTEAGPAAARESRRVAALPQAAPPGGSGARPAAEPPVLNDVAPVAAGVQRGAAARASATATATATAAAQAGTDTSGEVESAAAPAAAGRQPGAGADPGAVALRFVFEEECWVNVRDATGRQLMFGLREAGRIDERTGVPPISVILGRYPGVRVSVDGRRFEVPDAAVSGSVARFEISAP
jgi:cytoskeleton protein RodZ